MDILASIVKCNTCGSLSPHTDQDWQCPHYGLYYCMTQTGYTVLKPIGKPTKDEILKLSKIDDSWDKQRRQWYLILTLEELNQTLGGIADRLKDKEIRMGSPL